MLKNYKKQGLKLIAILTLGVLIISPAHAELPEEMILNFQNESIFPDDVTDVKFECSLEGWLIENGERTSKAEVAIGTTIAPKPVFNGIISVNFEPTVDNFELSELLDYACDVYVRNAADEEQGWVSVSAGSNTPDIGRIERTSMAATTSIFFGGRTIKLRGRLRGSD